MCYWYWLLEVSFAHKSKYMMNVALDVLVATIIYHLFSIIYYNYRSRINLATYTSKRIIIQSNVIIIASKGSKK